MNALHAISPVDGRYAQQTHALCSFFSEAALIKYRVKVEVEYLISLSYIVPQLVPLSGEDVNSLRLIYTQIGDHDFEEIKQIEKVTNHDVKAVEYFLRKKLEEKSLGDYIEFIHFGLTSQDINNTAFPLMVADGWNQICLPKLEQVIKSIGSYAQEWAAQPMLAHTHGQPASPTTLGKEFRVFQVRLQKALEQLTSLQPHGKFGGATGNFNAHFAAYPEIDWDAFANEFLNSLGLVRNYPTTQIDHYDDLSAFLDALRRVNIILIDLCRDIWAYISMRYFTQRAVAGEVGSSAMPHKVNPIDFENAEGNLGIANALLDFLSSKLPISRLQRDLTDSTVLRNLGVPLSHSLIAYGSILKGMGKISPNFEKINQDLGNNWAVVAEAIQTVLRRENYPNPYEALKNLTRGKTQIDQKTISDFIDSLAVGDVVKDELRRISPFNFIGRQQTAV